MQLSFVVKSRNTYLMCQSFSYPNYIVVFTGFIFSFLLIGPFTSRSHWKIDNDKCLGLDLARYVNQLVGQTISLYMLSWSIRSALLLRSWVKLSLGSIYSNQILFLHSKTLRCGRSVILLMILWVLLRH